MVQNYTFFIEGRLLTLVENGKYRHTVVAIIDNKERHILLYDLVHELKQVIGLLQNAKATSITLQFNNLEELLQKVKKCFKKHIIAAGGIVKNSNNDILFIYRNGFWDLPKGKVELNEDIANTAVREVMEETGMVNATLGKTLKTTFHTYKEAHYLVLKETRWYEMFSDDTALTPQIEEGITDLKWVPQAMLQYYIDRSYPNIKVLLDDYLSN
jgi:8-oxo-dGTP pyrophosphatase MutT (NUDIX family)